MQTPLCFELFLMFRNIVKHLCLYVHINPVSGLCGRLYNLLIRWKLKIVEPPSPTLFLSFFTCLCSPFSSSSFTTSCGVNPTTQHQSRRWASFMTEQHSTSRSLNQESSQVSITSRLFPRHMKTEMYWRQSRSGKNQSPIGLLNVIECSVRVWMCVWQGNRR